MTPVVVKVGGSLLGRRDLPARLHEWVMSRPGFRPVLLTGGGVAVKVRRGRGPSDDESAHWACIALMRDNTARLARAYPNGCLVDHWKQAESAWLRGSQPFFDVELFLRHGEAEADALPHSWDVSSDSIAARLAARHNADLVLIKACPVPTGPHDWPRLAATGLVDRWFSRVAQEVARITLEQWPA